MTSENGDSNHTTSAQSVGDSTIGDAEPFITSPYTSRAVTVSVGASGSKYTVLQAIVEQYSGLKERIDPNDPDAPVELREVDEDIGHTLIHYLYTGQYQTLSLASLPDDVRTATEFKRSVLAYCAARLCGIEKLEELTKAKIEELSKELTIFDVQNVAEEVTPKLPRSGDWFTAQVNKWVKTSLMANDHLLRERRLYELVGKSAVFDRAIVKAIAEMYKAKSEELSAARVLDRRPPVENAYVTASHERADSVVQVDGLPNGVPKDDKPHHSRGRIDLVTQNLDDPVAKTSTDEYSPMPDEEPLEPPFEKRQSSLERSETLSPRVETIQKPPDSEGEAPVVKVSKKSKKKKQKKAPEAAAPPEQVE